MYIFYERFQLRGTYQYQYMCVLSHNLCISSRFIRWAIDNNISSFLHARKYVKIETNARHRKQFVH